MIKFFRQIRQQLVNENNMQKYLLYAIGEILLVVIGILIALQINNWNQNRLNKIKELDYLQQLHSDLTADTIMYADFMEAVEYKEILLKSILKEDLTHFRWLNRNRIYDLFVSRFNAPPNSRDNTFLEMTSSGSLSLIQNQILKEQILNYYRLIHNRADALEVRFSEWPKVISEIIPGDKGIIDIYSNKAYDFPKEDEKTLIQTLLNQREKLLPIINAELQYTFKQRSSFTQLNEYVIVLLNTLNQEIAKRKN